MPDNYDKRTEDTAERGDDPDDRGIPDRTRVNLEDEREVRYWTERFGVSEFELRLAVMAVGHSAEIVAHYLGKADRSAMPVRR